MTTTETEISPALRRYFDMSRYTGRNDAVDVLLDNLPALIRDPEVATIALSSAWTGPDHPASLLVPGDWVTVIRALAFQGSMDPVDYIRRPPLLVDDRWDESQRPTEPLTLYRAAERGYERGMSWTGTLENARHFAGFLRGWQTREPVHIWRATLEPEGFLMRFIEDRNEDEWVVDPEWLEDAQIEFFEEDQTR